jgi:hypothetical protein
MAEKSNPPHILDLERVANALSSSLDNLATATFDNTLQSLAQALNATVVSAWHYNRSGFFSCYSRHGYSPSPGSDVENVHPADTSLLNTIVQALIKNTNSSVNLNLRDESLLRQHWAPAAIVSNSLSTVIAIPYYNYAISR